MGKGSPGHYHRTRIYSPSRAYADGMRGKNVMAVKRGPQSAATLGSRALRTWRSARAKNLIPRQPSHSYSPSLDLAKKKGWRHRSANQATAGPPSNLQNGG